MCPTLEGLQRRDIWEYPLEALREALVNALIHRDYTISADIQVRVYDDQLAIWSPGSLPEGIRLEQLREPGHPSVLRNPSIAQVLYYAGVIERWGTGTTRIIGWCTDQGLPEPAFEEDGDWFRTTFAADPYVPERLAAMGLSERQVRAVLYVKERGSISNQEYQELAGLKKRQSSDDLRFLADAGILERVGTTGRGTHYALKGRQRGERGAKGAPKGQSWPQSGIEGPTPGSESP